MNLRRLTLLTAAVLMLLLPGVLSAQTADYHLQLVTGTGTSDSTTAPSITITQGSNGSAIINIIPLNGFDQQVSFSCVGVPANGGCTFNPTTLTPSGSDPVWTTLTFTTTATSTAQASPLHKHWLLGSGLFAMGMLVIPFKLRRFRVATTLMVLALVSTFTLAACGGGSSTASNVVPIGTYSVLVNSTAGTITHSATLSVIVQK